ncbi:MAG: PqqD family protein [Deltaproteobacteria bacterium]
MMQKVYAKNPDIVFRQIADEAILVPVKNKVRDLESIYTLNPVAARIWELIDGVRKTDEIRDIIVNEFEVSTEGAEKDLGEFLETLSGTGGIKEV